MRKIKYFFALLLFIPFFAFAGIDDPTIRDIKPEAAGKVFQDATGLITNATPDLKSKVFLKSTAEINKSFDDAPLIGRVFILISDALKISIDFLFALFWIVGFAVFIISWIFLHEAADDDSGRHNKRSKNKWAVGGLILSTCLMAFNGTIMVFADTFGVGTNVHSTYDFRHSNVDRNTKRFTSKKELQYDIDPSTGEMIINFAPEKP